MRAMDRTLLASLGFAAPDKGEERHGLACLYLTQAEVASAIFASAVAPRYPQSGIVGSLSGAKIRDARLELPISKGEGQYKTTIGFLDAIVRFDVMELFQDGDEDRETLYLAFEVKSRRVPAADVVRQVQLYREYFNRDKCHWIVATLYPLSASDADMLRRERIISIQLGDKFEAWCETAKAAPSPDRAPLVF